MKKRGYNQFDFPLDGEHGFLFDDKYPPEDQYGYDPFCHGAKRNNFYYLTEGREGLGDYYVATSMDDPEGKGRDLYRLDASNSDGCVGGWDPFVVERVWAKHGRYMISGFNRVDLPAGDEDEED